jgi:hypothetical protein
MMSTTVWRRGAAAAVIGLLGLGVFGCGEAVRTGRSPVSLVVNRVEAASGAEPEEFANQLASDVETYVEQQIDGEQVRIPTIFADPGVAEFSLSLKDIGPPGSPAAPSTNNAVTINRYRVSYRRTDGRNAPGVDVPYAFEGAGTITVVPGANASLGFELVRIQAKEEPPLRGMRGGGAAIAISAIADVTFYGRDQVGNEVSATGSIAVTFADWGDPE